MPRSKLANVCADGEKVGVGLNLNAATRAKMGRLARHRGYTVTAFVEEVVERTQRRVTASCRSARQGLLRFRIDREPMEWSNGRRRARAITDSIHDLAAATPATLGVCVVRFTWRVWPRPVRKGDCRSFRALVLARCWPGRFSWLSEFG
jgi:hypothetical protein